MVPMWVLVGGWVALVAVSGLVTFGLEAVGALTLRELGALVAGGMVCGAIAAAAAWLYDLLWNCDQ